jgi:GTPase
MSPEQPSHAAPERAAATRTGYVTLLGRPNSGKSTLLNAFIGERLSIVTPRPQTTWWRVAGIRTDAASQMIFLDTPGIMEPASLIHRALLQEAKRALLDADVVLLVLDPTRPLRPEEREGLAGLCTGSGVPIVGVVNKTDVSDPSAIESEARWAQETLGEAPARISALRGAGVAELLERVRARLPEGPFLFPEDEIATAPVRFFVTEMVRETVFERFHEEVPYSIFCQVEEFREEESRTYIQVNIFVERSSQKGILVGKGGEAVRELGRIARRKIEHFLGTPVYLDLWIKVLPRWRKKRGQLRRLGLPVPEHDASNSNR